MDIGSHSGIDPGQGEQQTEQLRKVLVWRGQYGTDTIIWNVQQDSQRAARLFRQNPPRMPYDKLGQGKGLRDGPVGRRARTGLSSQSGLCLSCMPL